VTHADDDDDDDDDDDVNYARKPALIGPGLSQGSQIRAPDSKFSDSACRRFSSLGNVNVTAP
jgi:hypothetical protein